MPNPISDSGEEDSPAVRILQRSPHGLQATPNNEEGPAGANRQHAWQRGDRPSTGWRASNHATSGSDWANQICPAE